MLIKSTNSKYKFTKGDIDVSNKKGEQVLVSFFNIEGLKTEGGESVHIKSNDKLFMEHYYYKSIINQELDKRDQRKSGIIYY